MELLHNLIQVLFIFLIYICIALSYHTFTKGFPAPPRGDVVKTGRKYKVPAKITVIDLEAVPIDDNPANYQPTEAEINEYAKFLGFDLMKDKECLYVAKEGLQVFLFYLFIFRVNQWIIGKYITVNHQMCFISSIRRLPSLNGNIQKTLNLEEDI